MAFNLLLHLLIFRPIICQLWGIKSWLLKKKLPFEFEKREAITKSFRHLSVMNFPPAEF